jgi:predicted dehydrogenase
MHNEQEHNMLNVAIYGMGNWGSRLIESVQGKSNKIKFVSGITRDLAAHRASADKYGMTLTSDYAGVLRDPKIDAVLIATPHSMHCDHICAAARAGKHVFAEKPLTLTAATARQVVDATQAAGVTLGLGFNRRYAPSFVEMKRRVLAGDIGELVHIEGHHSGPTGFKLKPNYWRSTRAESPAGGMSPRGIHTLDAMINLGGLVSEVYAHSERRVLQAPIDMDDTTSMLLKFKNGITGYFATIFVTGELYRVHVFGTKGWLELRGDTELIARGLEGNPQAMNLPVVDKERAELEAFADAVAAKQAYMVPPDETVNGIAVIEAIVASEETKNIIKIK